jgi:hypothetical protein
MQRFMLSAVACLTILVYASPLSADLYSDDLGKCLVAFSNADDQALLVQWIFALVSVNPAVKTLANVSDAQRIDLSQKAMALSERLLEKDCRPQAVAAIKYTGPHALESSFSVLGQVAMRGLMSDPAVTMQMQSLDKYINRENLTALYKEAGITVPTPPKPAN